MGGEMLGLGAGTNKPRATTIDEKDCGLDAKATADKCLQLALQLFPHTSPYSIQLEFMQAMLKTILASRIGIMESPTGTGKTMSILCAGLAWQLATLNPGANTYDPLDAQDNMKNGHEPEMGKGHPLESDHKQTTNEPEWIAKERKKLLLSGMQTVPTTIVTNTTSRVGSKGMKRTWIDQGRDEKFACLGIDEQIQRLLQSAALPSRKERSHFKLPSQANSHMPRIYFCSRTHSQLSQVMEELDKIIHKQAGRQDEQYAIGGSNISADATRQNTASRLRNYHAVSIGSRKNLCINPQVAELGSIHRINEKCLELQQSSNNSNGDLDGGSDHKNKCKYNRSNLPAAATTDEGVDGWLERGALPNDHQEFGEYSQFIEAVQSTNIVDIEELVKLGKRTCTCPYYGGRMVSQSFANFIALPYNLILKESNRKALGLELKDSLVIFDEAHNLVDMINQMHSVLIDANLVERTGAALDHYLDRFGNGRLSHDHLRLLKQLEFILARLNWFCKNLFVENGTSQLGPPSPHQDRLVKEECWKINDFLHILGIDHINIFPIEAYVTSSHLSPKLSPTEPYGLSEIINFLLGLANSDKDGRVLTTHEPGEPSKGCFKYINLNPAGPMLSVVNEAAAVILAGGTMTPREDLLQQLFKPSLDDIVLTSFPNQPVVMDRIDNFSCGHLIGLDRCMVLPLAYGPTDQYLKVTTTETRGNVELIRELGQIVINFSGIVPAGMVCFFPSYDFLEMVYEEWNRMGVLESIEKGKQKKIFVETRSHKKKELLQQVAHKADMLSDHKYVGSAAALEGYTNWILGSNKVNDNSTAKGALLLAVIGGSLSEGVNFSDNLGRMVLVIGMPYPDIRDPETKARIEYLSTKDGDKPERIGSNSSREREQLTNQCMRSVNQTIGRIIRHGQDYGVVALVDARYSQATVQAKLSRWIQQCIPQEETTRFGAAYSLAVKFFKPYKH